jgi:hypothetical protein
MLSTYGANLYVGVMLGISVAPTTLYLAILDTTPDPNDSGTDIAAYEPSSLAYERVEILTGNADWDTPSGGMSIYLSSIGYNPDSNWGSFGYYALCTAITAGEVLMFGSLGGTVAFSDGATITIPFGALSIGIG